MVSLRYSMQGVASTRHFIARGRKLHIVSRVERLGAITCARSHIGSIDETIVVSIRAVETRTGNVGDP